MRSAHDDDLTRRARVRDAALALFAERGYAATSVRSIADSAGVSSALVAHHFGSKPELRRACDDYVLAMVLDAKEDLGAADPAGATLRWLLGPTSSEVLLAYVARMLVEDSEASLALVERLVSQTEQMLERGVAGATIGAHGDPRLLAILLTVQGLAPLMMHRQLGALMGGVTDLEGVLRQLAVPLLELYTHGLYTDSRLLDAVRGATEGEGVI